MSTLAIHDMFRLYLLKLYTTIKYYIFPLVYRTAACAINAWSVVTYFIRTEHICSSDVKQLTRPS